MGGVSRMGGVVGVRGVGGGGAVITLEVISEVSFMPCRIYLHCLENVM